MLVDVPTTTRHWETDAITMVRAMLAYHNVVREKAAYWGIIHTTITNQHNCADHRVGGHEVRVEGDVFLLIFDGAASALSFCMQTQLALMECKWPDKILTFSEFKEEWTGGNTSITHFLPFKT